MTERRREHGFAVGIAAVLLVGLAFDLRADEVPPPASGPAARGGFEAHSVFCPGAVAPGAADVALAVAGLEDTVGPVGIEPQEENPVDVPEAGALIYDVRDGTAADVVGYGERATAAALTTTERPGAGAGAALCAPQAGDEWYFAAGSASIHADERILLYNPFPDEAVVRLSVFTPEGEQTKASLADVAVPAGDFRVVPLNERVLVEETLAVAVVAERGRVVAWRQLFVEDGDRIGGAEFSLGAPEPATTWYFPEGAAGGGASERIALLNPTEEEAVVAVSLAVGRRKAISPPALMEIAIAPRSQLVVGVGKHVRTSATGLPVAATVRSLNEVPVVAEREVIYAGEEGRGRAAEVGATGAHRGWLLPPAARGPGEDALAILNPSTAPARLSVRLVTRKGRGVPAPDLEQISIGPSGRVRLPVARYTSGRAVVAIVESNVPVVAERFATSRPGGDVASVMGIPLP